MRAVSLWGIAACAGIAFIPTMSRDPVSAAASRLVFAGCIALFLISLYSGRSHANQTSKQRD